MCQDEGRNEQIHIITVCFEFIVLYLLLMSAWRDFSFTEGLSLEQFSAVTQVVISVMNLSDMLQQDREDSSSSELVDTQQNR